MQHLQRPLPGQVTGVAIPSEPGTYALILHVATTTLLNVGKLGAFRLPRGHYVYIGSAHGPGGLRARVGRHIHAAGPHHWHIDTLRSHATIQAVIYTITQARLECAWTQTLACLLGAQTPSRGFGSSNCKSGCTSHLIALPPRITARDLQQFLSSSSDKLSMIMV